MGKNVIILLYDEYNKIYEFETPFEDYYESVEDRRSRKAIEWAIAKALINRVPIAIYTYEEAWEKIEEEEWEEWYLDDMLFYDLSDYKLGAYYLSPTDVAIERVSLSEVGIPVNKIPLNHLTNPR